MNNKKSTNSVFPYMNKEDALDLISGAHEVLYDSRVKISNWHEKCLMEPRDNTEFFPPNGNLRMATYKRFGTYSPESYLTETKDKMRKYNPCDFEKCSQPVKMLNIFSFPLTDICTTEKTELETESIPEKISEEFQDTLCRRTLGYSLEDLEKLKGMRTFLDDDLEIHKKISDLKVKRYNR